MRKRIFWAADSTVAQNTIESYPQTGMGQTLPLYLNEDVIVYNFARNGRSSKSFINEGVLEKIKEELKEGDFLFIQFGHNDQKPDEERRTEAFSTYQEHLSIYVETARRYGVYPVFITSLYRRLFSEDGHIKDKVHFDYPDAMKELGEKLNVPVIDLCQKSKELFEETGEEKSRQWFMNLEAGKFKSYMDGLQDNTHLRYEGAVIMSGLVAEGLKELGGIYSDLIMK